MFVYLQVVNRISQLIIEELQFNHLIESAASGIIGLCSDATAGVYYAYDQNSIYEVCIICVRCYIVRTQRHLFLNIKVAGFST